MPLHGVRGTPSSSCRTPRLIKRPADPIVGAVPFGHQDRTDHVDRPNDRHPTVTMADEPHATDQLRFATLKRRPITTNPHTRRGNQRNLEPARVPALDTRPPKLTPVCRIDRVLRPRPGIIRNRSAHMSSDSSLHLRPVVLIQNQHRLTVHVRSRLVRPKTDQRGTSLTPPHGLINMHTQRRRNRVDLRTTLILVSHRTPISLKSRQRQPLRRHLSLTPSHLQRLPRQHHRLTRHHRLPRDYSNRQQRRERSQASDHHLHNDRDKLRPLQQLRRTLDTHAEDTNHSRPRDTPTTALAEARSTTRRAQSAESAVNAGSFLA